MNYKIISFLCNLILILTTLSSTGIAQISTKISKWDLPDSIPLSLFNLCDRSHTYNRDEFYSYFNDYRHRTDSVYQADYGSTIGKNLNTTVRFYLNKITQIELNLKFNSRKVIAKVNYITPFSKKSLTISDFQCSKIQRKRNEYYIIIYADCVEIRGIINLNSCATVFQPPKDNFINDSIVIIDKKIKQILDTLNLYEKVHLIQRNDTFFATFGKYYRHKLNWCIINNKFEFINNNSLKIVSSKLALNTAKLDIDSIIYGELSCEFLDTTALIDNYIQYQRYFKAIIKPNILLNKRIINQDICTQQPITSFHGNCIEKLAFLESDTLFINFLFSSDKGLHSFALGLSVYQNRIDKIAIRNEYDTGNWPINWSPRKFELILDKTEYKENEEIKGCIDFLFYDSYYNFMHEGYINGSFKLDINGMLEYISNGSKSVISKNRYIKFINGKK